MKRLAWPGGLPCRLPPCGVTCGLPVVFEREAAEVTRGRKAAKANKSGELLPNTIFNKAPRAIDSFTATPCSPKPLRQAGGLCELGP